MPDTPSIPPVPARSRTVLVTGATGNLGRELLARLHARPAAVRRLDRRPVGPRPGVESVRGDLTDGGSVRAALDGVDTVFLIWPLLDTAPAGPLIAELAAAAPRVVYLSSTAIDDDAVRQSDPIVQVHADMERLLRDAGLRPTVLRSDTLASNTLGWAAQLRAGDVVRGPDTARTAVVDEGDVAAAAVEVLLRRGDDADRTPYLLTGPEPLGRADQVAILGAALGRELRFEPVPADAARARMLADGRPERLVDALVTASLRRPESRLVTDHVERLTGMPARSFAQWAVGHGAEFGRRP
ncbi:NAD(P)H-binding protein [Streptomyces sp. NPDC089915]|uniref:NAD(P)H-binding protein n=1 Tax=Streptomyces sp. NPDC089915 TaxID=3155186 RepID=UPI0034267529